MSGATVNTRGCCSSRTRVRTCPRCVMVTEPHASAAAAAAARVIVVMGVSGAAKTTVGRLLAERLGWHFADADDHHPPENVRKMASGIPLSDEDRIPWLGRRSEARRVG